MAIDELLGALEAEASARVAAERAAGHAEAERIAAESAARSEARRTAHRQQAELRARVQADATFARAKRAARTEVLTARAAVLERILTCAAVLLRDVHEANGSGAWLERHLGEALAYVGTDGVVLQCRPELEPHLRELAVRHHVQLEVNADAGTGIRLIEPAKGYVVDNTLEARLERVQQVLSIEVLRKIDESADGSLG
jgi:vacuolar-type H+-ATPase subunit E/Vma4